MNTVNDKKINRHLENIISILQINISVQMQSNCRNEIDSIKKKNV